MSVVFTWLTALRLTLLHHRGLCSFVMLLASTGGWSPTCCPPNVCNKLPILKSQNMLDILILEDWTDSCHKMSVRIYKLILLRVPEQQRPRQPTMWYSLKPEQVHHNSDHYTVHCYYFPQKIFCEITFQTAPSLWITVSWSLNTVLTII